MERIEILYGFNVTLAYMSAIYLTLVRYGLDLLLHGPWLKTSFGFLVMTLNKSIKYVD